MQNLQNIQEKIFQETQNIIETLGKITTKEDLQNNQNLVLELSDRVSFLKILNENKEFLTEESSCESTDNQLINVNLHESENFNEIQNLKSNLFENNNIEEEQTFFDEINEGENSLNEDQDFSNKRIETENNEEIGEEELNSTESNKEEIFEIDNESLFSDEILIIKEEILPTYEERVAQKEKDFLEMEERRRKIVEFSKQKSSETVTSELMKEESKMHSPVEKKFKLANIKGIKAVKNLFDEDPLENLEEEIMIQQENEAKSILNTNIPTDFMEATKKRTEFRIDFNDKIAFTKLLFAGDENDLKSTIDQLNSYDNLEDAKQFLSEVYYKKDWKKADEYAQRLWTLVENKFL